MATSETTLDGARAEQIASVKGTLGLYALIALGFEGAVGVLAFSSDGPTQMMAIGGMALVAGLMVVIAGRNWESLNSGRVAVEVPWGADHLPLSAEHKTMFQGTWLCRWSVRDADGTDRPYVDDTVLVTRVDLETGEVEGRGTEDHGSGQGGYRIRGRLSRQGLAHLFYIFPPPLEKMAGMTVLRVHWAENEIRGWWIGVGRKGGDIEGPVTWYRQSTYDGAWQNQNHAHTIQT